MLILWFGADSEKYTDKILDGKRLNQLLKKWKSAAVMSASVSCWHKVNQRKSAVEIKL